MRFLPRRGQRLFIASAAIVVVALQHQARGAGCCFPDGTCTSAFGNACSRGGGTQVESCTPDACLGACCSDSECSLTIADACTLPVYYGIGTTCAPCLGACCLGDGSCDELTASICILQGGVLQGLGTYCADTICVGACCSADGGCAEIGPDPCALAGENYQGRGTACEPLMFGDLDCDGALLPEWGAGWPGCLRGPEQTVNDLRCDAVDMDIDGDVDLADVAYLGLFQGYQACAAVPFPCCGNGVVELGEHCDDGNTTPDDGCNPLCRLECVPGTLGCGWRNGDMITYNQESWGGDPSSSTAAALLFAQFNSRFPTGLVVGYASGFQMAFTSAAAILNFLPHSGAAAPLNSDLLDPSSSPSGVYGGFVLALQLDVDFAVSAQLSGASGLALGDLTLCGLTTTPGYNGMTVRRFLNAMNTALGAGPTVYDYDDTAILTNEVSSAFESGVPSPFAQEHLFNGACPCTPGTAGCGWRNGDMVTYSQESWGGEPTQSTAATLLVADFNSRYPGGVEVGLQLGAGFSMFFSSAQAILEYLPGSGATGALNADLNDPTSSASGYFGGWVLAFQLNVDFADSGQLAGTSGLVFGDLRMCGLTATPAYNGMNVRQFLGTMNTALGGGAISYNYDTIGPLTEDLTRAFEGGSASQFAQDHLFNGACPCTPGAPGCGWEDGDMVTYNQESWGGDPTQSAAATLVLAQFNSRYPAGMEVGLAGATGFSMAFTSGSAILAYEPASGAFSALNSDHVDPTSSASGTFGGHVLAIQLDVDFADSGQISGTSGLIFGELRLCNLTSTPVYDGLTVRQFLGEMNTALGGGAAAYNFDTIGPLAGDVGSAFEGGVPSPFAQEHLFNGACPCTPGAAGCGWKTGDVVTYTQVDWGDPSGIAGILLSNQYDFVYFSKGGELEVGLPGSGGFSMIFSGAVWLLSYLPGIGNPGALNTDLVDPTTSSAGAFGGEVVALRLNIDFAEAGHTLGTSGLLLGDLTLCNFASNPALNGTSVGDFLAILNSALGRGPAPYTINQLHLIAEQVDAAFNNGHPTSFAQDHLFNGPCSCTPGAPGCGWQDGDLVTYNQENWGALTGSASTLLSQQFSTVYPGGVEIGISRPNRDSAIWTTAQAVLDYLPTNGPPGSLGTDLLNPTTTSSGALGGNALALRLNIDFDNAGVLSETAPLNVAALRVCGLTATPGLNGSSVSEILAQLNEAIGGSPAVPYSYDDLDSLARELTQSFEGGVPSQFAQDRLFNGPCP